MAHIPYHSVKQALEQVFAGSDLTTQQLHIAHDRAKFTCLLSCICTCCHSKAASNVSALPFSAMVTIQPQQLAPTMMWTGRARNRRFPSLPDRPASSAPREQQARVHHAFWDPRFVFWEYAICRGVRLFFFDLTKRKSESGAWQIFCTPSRLLGKPRKYDWRRAPYGARHRRQWSLSPGI
jgi:hypothetical protein